MFWGMQHGGRGCGRGHGNNNNNNSNKVTPNASGFYPTVEWNKLSFEERDKIQKEHDKKGKPGGTKPGGTKQIIGDISVEHITAIIKVMQQAQSAIPTEETELTSHTTQAGNSFGSKANIKKFRTIE